MIKLMADKFHVEEKFDKTESLLTPTYIQSYDASNSSNIIILDSSSLESKLDETVREIKQANSIILVYDMNNLETITPLSHYWLPLIQDNNKTAPILLVGNKLDLVIINQEKYVKTNVRKIISMLFKKYKQLELGIECSVKENISVQEVLYSAQTMVIYPLSKLCNK